MRRTLTTLLFLVMTGPARAGAAPVATYEPVQDLKGYRSLAFQPWSPDGRLLALIGIERGELSIWDASRPEKPPRVLASGGNELARWSPDGGWLLTEGGDRGPSVYLIAIRIADAHADTVCPAGVWPFLWASDGKIYCWSGDQPLRHRITLEPPKLWSSEHKGSPRAKAVLLPPEPFGFLPGPQPKEWDLAVTREQPGTPVLLRNTFPGDSLYLAALCIQHPVKTVHCVINLKGDVVRELGAPYKLDWNSVSPDGRYLLGEREGEEEAATGHVHSTLYVGDSRGEWSMPVKDAPEGTSPHWAPRGTVFCAEDHVNGVLHVGRIRFDRAPGGK